MKRRIELLAAVALVALIAASATLGASGTTTTLRSGTSSLGRIVVDGQGRTLYLFEKDRNRRSACYGACAIYWPPLLTHGRPIARGGLRQSLVGTTRRKNGTLQVTYAGHPLYRYVGDSGRGQTNGAGLTDYGGGWDPLSPAGKKIEAGD
ncbi:MAG TPA: hypothetical protein VKA21_05170 [Candidatus Binatia bacterium]|nr:hypothetical protein [Candidatus Binatia bacterium]